MLGKNLCVQRLKLINFIEDEKGAAAALSAHLDEALDDLPVYHINYMI